MQNDSDPGPIAAAAAARPVPSSLDGPDDDTFGKSALQWRIQHIKVRRQKLWQRRQAKLEKLKSKTKLMDKTALLGGHVPGPTTGVGMRLKDLDLDADGVDTEEDDEETNSGMYWSAERGLHEVNPSVSPRDVRRKKTEPAARDWRDDYLMYPLIVLSGCTMSAIAIFGAWYTVSTGLWWHCLLWLCRLCVAFGMALINVTIAVFLYEHCAQARGPYAVSMPCGLAYLVLVPIGMTWPSATMLPVAATALMGFGFAVLGISPGRGTKFPVLVLFICAGVCVVFEPTLTKMSQLLGISFQALW